MSKIIIFVLAIRLGFSLLTYSEEKPKEEKTQEDPKMKVSLLVFVFLLFSTDLLWPARSSAEFPVESIYKGSGALVEIPATVGAMAVQGPVMIAGFFGCAFLTSPFAIAGPTIGNELEFNACTDALYLLAEGLGHVGHIIVGTPFYLLRVILLDIPGAIFASNHSGLDLVTVKLSPPLDYNTPGKSSEQTSIFIRDVWPSDGLTHNG